MNERIEELKTQCIVREQRGTNAFDSYMVDRFDTKKFAELIIQECILAAETDWHTPDGWGWTLGQAKAIEFIYERFGIEE